ncbi:hypothetical protein [Aeromicrobium ginsengisoli]|uniref:DUF4267 domain-containing protein n=1 Tax=Aeromicrobium ginsengisoli TaxID=363867 RepID=A0A5M4FFV6_9ACTN|nr:hypothetical protein [Aeromicrobium ginsengisoli]KAA1398194.1 hypothetical protein ESP70_012785 [Aeromicrobium ginsengisoli]
MKKPSYSAMISVATVAYSVFALAKPRHLGNAITASPLKQPDYDIAARTFGVRDLVVSGLALAAPTAQAREQAMMGRVVFDLTDSALFTNEATTAGRKAKVLAVTVGWAALNVAAIVADRKR